MDHARFAAPFFFNSPFFLRLPLSFAGNALLRLYCATKAYPATHSTRPPFLTNIHGNPPQSKGATQYCILKKNITSLPHQMTLHLNNDLNFLL
jgi:hypothetical protein